MTFALRRRASARAIVAACSLLVVLPASSALGTVDQTRESTHHAVFSGHDLNICGNPGTFTFDVFSRTQTLDNGNTFSFKIHETYTYSLVFDDPALGTWTAHAAENIHFTANRSGQVFFDNFNSKEGPVQIIQHQRFRTDADGNVTVDRTFERIVGC
jgi:hypothetical protein